MTQYLFVRIRVTKPTEVTAELNDLAGFGWRVVSHAEAGGEYSVVLQRDDEIAEAQTPNGAEG